MLTGTPKYLFMVLCLLLIGDSNGTGYTQESIEGKEVSGASLKGQIDSQNDMRDNGKKILYSIMEQYPKLWNAKQILEPKIENGSIAISLEISVDKEKYLAWAETLCGIMDKSANEKYLLSFKKGGHANYNKPLSRVLSKSPDDYLEIVINDPYYYSANPQRIGIQEGLPKTGKIFSVIKEFSSDGNCEMVCFLIKTSNPLFSIFDSNKKNNYNNYLSFRFGDLFLPNQLEIILLDSANRQLQKKIYRSPTGSSLWDSGSFHFAMNNSKGKDHLNPVTPFPFIYQQRGFENGHLNSVYSTKCYLKALIPTRDIEVEKISKITSSFSISK